MRSKTAGSALLDLRDNIFLAKDFTKGIPRETFLKDKRSLYAVIRCLEIISEASRRLPEGTKQKYPLIPWSDIAGAGNVYRHDYENVLELLVWETVRTGLDDLLQVVLAELETVQK